MKKDGKKARSVMIYVDRDDRARIAALGRRDRRSIKGQIGVVIDKWCQDAGIDSELLIKEYNNRR